VIQPQSYTEPFRALESRPQARQAGGKNARHETNRLEPSAPTRALPVASLDPARAAGYHAPVPHCHHDAAPKEET